MAVQRRAYPRSNSVTNTDNARSARPSNSAARTAPHALDRNDCRNVPDAIARARAQANRSPSFWAPSGSPPSGATSPTTESGSLAAVVGPLYDRRNGKRSHPAYELGGVLILALERFAQN